jgi:spermidine/putrescine transport system substrate-binding protein
MDQFFDPRLKGRVTVLVEMVDTMGLMLNWLGFDMSDFTDDQFTQALDALSRKVDEGQIRQAMGNDYIGALSSGDAIASFGWSGDVLALGDQFDFSMPESGGMVWADAMLIPSTATHKANAEHLMNYYYDPVIAARLASWIQYVCPVQGAQEAMKQVDPALADNPWIFPTPELLSASSEFMLMTPAQRDAYARSFVRIMG